MVYQPLNFLKNAFVTFLKNPVDKREQKIMCLSHMCRYSFFLCSADC